MHQRGEKIDLDHHHQGAGEKDQETPEKEGVKYPSILDPPDFVLAEYLDKEPSDALAIMIEAVERFALTPDPRSLPEPPGHDAEGSQGEDIHRQDDAMADVPVDFAGCLHSNTYNDLLRAGSRPVTCPSRIKVNRNYASSSFGITIRWISLVPS